MKLICIGRNYADHASELGNAVPAEPLFFLKPDSAVLPHRHPFYIPAWTQEVHHEVELLVRITRNGKSIAPEFAHRISMRFLWALTSRRDAIGTESQGHPWRSQRIRRFSSLSKKWLPKSTWANGWEQVPFALKKNGEVVQSATAESMLFHVHELISHVSHYMTLKMGDILFTGTPAGWAGR